MEIIIGIIIVCFLFKFLLLNPKVNSILTIIGLVTLVILKPFSIEFTNLTNFLIIINIADCIHDIVLSNGFYYDPSDKINSMYVYKSLSVCILGILCCFDDTNSITIALLPRLVFICVIYPLIFLTVSGDIQEKMRIGYPLPYYSWHYSKSSKKCYIYGKMVKKLFDRGKLVANIETIKSEVGITQGKLNAQNPSNFVKKLIRNVFEDKEQKEKRVNAENKISTNMISRYTAYISSNFYENYSEKITNALIKRQETFSPWKIKELVELEELNLLQPNGIFETVEWSEYFIIQCLNKMVAEGKIQDFKCSDEALNNHSYGVSMIRRDANSNPALALDD